MSVIFQTACVQVVFHAEPPILELVWHSCPPNNTLPATMRRLRRLTALYQPAGWLVNGYEMRALTPADQQWLIKYLVPQLFGRPNAPLAVVAPRNVASQLTLNTVLVHGAYPFGNRPRQFSTRVAAWKWLTEVSARTLATTH